MGKYTVIAGQNIFDVAIHIYGSIEGVVDLLMNNEKLSYASALKQGDTLNYTDGFIINPEIVVYNRNNNIVPANGERNVYYKEHSLPKLWEIRLPNNETHGSFSIAGSGNLEIDWGDNTAIQQVKLTGNRTEFLHAFDNAIAKNRRIRIYGEVILSFLDFTNLNPTTIIQLKPIQLQQFRLADNTVNIDFISLFEKLREADLSGLKMQSLLPLTALKELRVLDLSGIRILRESLDEYLITLVKKHYQRKSCTVRLSIQPSGTYQEAPRDENNNYLLTTGMEAVWLLTNEPSWNEAGFWKFIINEEIYTAEA